MDGWMGGWVDEWTEKKRDVLQRVLARSKEICRSRRHGSKVAR